MEIRLESVHKTYRLGDNQVRAIRDVSLDLPPGDFVALSGPSGAGKSTLLGLIGGLERPDEGHVWAGDRDLATLGSEDLAMYRRHNVGFVFQAFRLLPALTAFENVMMPVVPLAGSDREKRDKARAAMERTNIDHRADHLPGELSGGEQQRVAIARAIVNGPDLIIADEPTGELDRDNGQRIMELLHALNSNGETTVLLASHDPEAVSAAERIVTLVDGQIETEQTEEG